MKKINKINKNDLFTFRFGLKNVLTVANTEEDTPDVS